MGKKKKKKPNMPRTQMKAWHVGKERNTQQRIEGGKREGEDISRAHFPRGSEPSRSPFGLGVCQKKKKGHAGC